MPTTLELPSKLDVVVDLTVLHDPESAALVAQGLIAPFEVDDGETSVRHAEDVVEIEADAVRAAMVQLTRHGQEHVAVDGAARTSVDPGDAAHCFRQRIGAAFPRVDLLQGTDRIPRQGTAPRCAKIRSVEKAVRDFLAANYFLGDDPNELAGSASLIEAGLIDSTGVLELVGFLEDRFDVRITNEELLPENLDSIDNIVAFVTKKVGSPETA